jgi:type IV pilus assembly protein PilV
MQHMSKPFFHAAPHPAKVIRGITMIENLIALLILSIGLLGLAGLQASSFRNSKDATFRAIATQQATDMVNRIRANNVGVVNGEYSAIPSGAVPPPFCDAVACDDSELAAFDEWEWNSRNAALLPGGSGTVVGTPMTIVSSDRLLTPIQLTITVMWDGDRTGATGTGCNPANSADMNCLTLQVIAP